MHVVQTTSKNKRHSARVKRFAFFLAPDEIFLFTIHEQQNEISN